MRKLRMIFGLLREISFIAITWNPESNCTCREKNHFTFRWSTSTLQDWHIHHYTYCWKTDWWLLERGGRKRIVRCVDRIHKICSPKGKATGRRHMVRVETYKETDDLKTRQWMARCVEIYVLCRKKKAKQRWVIEKPKLGNARQIRGIFFIEPEDEEFKLTMKNARRKLEIPMPAPMPCKTPRNCRWEACHIVGKHKTKYACVVDADEFMRIRLEGVPHRYHEDHISAKGMSSKTNFSLVQKFIPVPQALKIPDAKAGSAKKWENWKNTGMAADESQKQERSDRRSKEWGQKISSRVIDGCLSSWDFGVGTSVSKVQRQSHAPMWRCERWFSILRTIHWTRIISITNDSRKSHGHYFKTTRMRRTSSRCSTRFLSSGQNGRRINVLKNSKVRMSTYLDTSTEAEMAQIMVQYGRSSRSFRKEVVRSPSDRTIVVNDNLRKFYWNTVGKKVLNWERLFVNRKRIILILVCGRNQTGRQDRKHRTDVENSHERRWFGRTNIVSWPFIFGLHSKRVSNQQSHVWIHDFCWIQGKTTDQSFRETWCRNVWRSRKEMCGKILRICKWKRLNHFTKSQHMHGWPSIKRRRKWVCGRIVYSLLTNCSENVCIWLVLEDLTYYGLWTNLLVRSRNGQDLVTNAWHVWSRTFIIQVNTGNVVMLEEAQHNNADLDCFETLILQETLKTQNQHQEEFCAFSEVTRLCQWVGCADNLWDLVIEVFHFVPNGTDGPKREPWWDPSAIAKPNMHKSIPIKHTNVIPPNIDHIPPNTTHSGPSAMLYVFEDNEAVIKMIFKGRSPTMRHVSRKHKVSLDWLFDRMNLDPKIQIHYIDKKHQLADILTKENFTRDEWNNLLHLSNITHFSSTCCTKNFSLVSCSTMAKRMQEQKEERVVSKSRPAAMNISSFIATSSSTASSPIASKSPGCRQLRVNPTAGWVLNQAHSMQRRCLKCDSRMHTSAGEWKGSGGNRRIKKKMIQKTPTILRLRPGTTTENLLPKIVKLWDQFFSWPGKSKGYSSDMEPLPPHIAEHI